MGDAGSPYALFQRSIEKRNLVSATSAAYALPELSLADAAALIFLAAEKDPDGMYPRAAARWAARYLTEVPRVDIGEAVLLRLEKVEASFTRGIWPSVPSADE